MPASSPNGIPGGAFEPALLDEAASRERALAHCNRAFAAMSVEDRIAWSLTHLPGEHVLTSSFGAQAAVMLHLLTRQRAGIPVILIDTGYLFPETYRFVDALTERLGLNLHVYRAQRSPAWQEARDGQRWLRGRVALEDYNREVKVEPMLRAIDTLGVGTWFAGLRRSQSDTRRDAAYLSRQNDRWKVHPIADWSDRDVHRYLRSNELPYHPLWERGYASIGDVHSTRSLHEVSDVAELRFAGIKRECGLHELDSAGPQAASGGR